MTAAIVIPALNEVSTVRDVIESIHDLGYAIVVDDGSTDATAAVARDAGAVVVAHNRNMGYDAALASGLRAGIRLGVDVLATLDADAEHDVTSLAEAIAVVQRGEAVVALGARGAPSRLAERVFSLYSRWRFGVPDILCGVKVYESSFVAEQEAVLDRRTIGTGLALLALREGKPFVMFNVPTRPRRPSRFGRGLRPNLAIGAAMIGAMADDVASRFKSRR